MSKIHKIEMYIVDINDNFVSISDYIDSYNHELDIKIINKETKEFEWHDDLPINHYDCKIEEYEKYFEDK